MRIGLVSDTHGLFDPRLRALLGGVDMILHAGDVGSQDVLDELDTIAPTRAVRGNVDSAALRLPPSLLFEAQGMVIEVVHILPASQSQLRAWGCARPLTAKQARERDRLLAVFPAGVRAVVFGHSHQPGIDWLEPVVFINPGSAGKRRFSLPRSCAVAEVRAGGIEVKISSLEDYNQIMARLIRFGASPSC
ncbi:MAG: metallophosphoesterase family protein [Terriglobia bacterium]